MAAPRAQIDLLVASIREKQRTLTAARRAFHEGLSGPCASLREGPLECGAVEVHAFLFEEAERPTTELPDGLRHAPGGRVLVVFLDLDGVPAGSGDPIAYREALTLVPVEGPAGPALFVLEDHVDDLFAVLVGREKLGLPRQASRVAISGGGVELTSGTRLLFRASWRGERRVAAAELSRKAAGVLAAPGGSFALLAHRRVAASGGLHTDELVSVEATASRLTGAAALQRVTVAPKGGDHRGRRLVHAARFTLRLRLEEARLVRSFLPEPPPATLGSKALGFLGGLVRG